MNKPKTSALKGHLVLSGPQLSSIDEGQIQLLLAIDQCGSIAAAARSVGISYKTAWDRVNAMNNLTVKPLVIRTAGGTRGGGTRLTEAGSQLIEGFQALQREHEDFVSRLGNQIDGLEDVADFIRDNRLLTSARNQYRGRVNRIRRGAVNAEIEVALSESLLLVATITNASRRQLQLKKGSEVLALVKSSWIILSTDANVVTSARNRLSGTVAKVIEGEVNSEVVLDLGDGKTLCALLTNASVVELALQTGTPATAHFKASSVILARN